MVNLSEKKVLVLGAGMVVKPIVQYLLNNDIQVTVATRTESKAIAMIDGHPNGKSLAWTVDDPETLDKLVAENDLSVSLLPFDYHPMVARMCIKHKKDMVTTSYVKQEMKALDAEAKQAGIIILNEIGVDPGIDHMSAMRIIDNVHNKGGEIEEFYSFCGALAAPEVKKNPFSYKFSWAPKGVLMAGNNEGKYLLRGEIKDIPSEDIFKNPLSVDFPQVGKLEVYPNRDSLPYIDIYGIKETKTMFRGTFRYKNWCESIDAMKTIGLFSYDKLNLEGKTYADMIATLIKADDSSNIRQKAADYLSIDTNSQALKAIEWTGLFGNMPVNRTEDSPFEVTSDMMIEKMMIGKEERDMVVMQHTFLAKYPDGKKEVIKSRMLDFGSLKTDTSIARTVALPAAIGVRMILEGKININGVYIPVIPEIYNPILNSLEEMNIKMNEEYGLPVSENIK